ncbi:MAG: hypothetical protein AAF602_23815 [Myxococcota bacterium]
MNAIWQELDEQWWDDHRYYHQSYVNQALHLFSASCFLVAYGLFVVDWVAATWIGGVLALWSRQVGHFFFEPRGHDTVHDVSHAHKESIKVGFNLARKTALFVAWFGGPLLLLVPDGFEAVAALSGHDTWVANVAFVWLGVGLSGFGLRTLWLVVFHSPVRGLVWAFKIVADPFHDVWQYHRAPLYLLRGERFEVPRRPERSL